MRYLKYLVLLLALVALPSVHSQAQVSFGVQVGSAYGGYAYDAPPVCEYGFYPTYPYGCAPYGYYGPQWFVGGVFIGAGPWHNFYYTHPGFYRPFYSNRGFGVHEGFRSFGGRDNFRGGDFHTYRGGERAFNDDRGYRGGDRSYDGGRSYNNGYRGGSYNGGSHYGSGGGSSYSGGSHNGGSYNGGGKSYTGGGSHYGNGGGSSYSGGSHNGGSYNGGGKSYSGGGSSYKGGGSHSSGSSHGGSYSHGGGEHGRR